MKASEWRIKLIEQYGHTFTPSQLQTLRDGPNSMAQAYHLAHLYKKYGHLVDEAGGT